MAVAAAAVDHQDDNQVAVAAAAADHQDDHQVAVAAAAVDQEDHQDGQQVAVAAAAVDQEDHQDGHQVAVAAAALGRSQIALDLVAAEHLLGLVVPAAPRLLRLLVLLDRLWFFPASALLAGETYLWDASVPSV